VVFAGEEDDIANGRRIVRAFSALTLAGTLVGITTRGKAANSPLPDPDDKDKIERGKALYRKAWSNTAFLLDPEEDDFTPSSEKPAKPTDSDKPGSDLPE